MPEIVGILADCVPTLGALMLLCPIEACAPPGVLNQNNNSGKNTAAGSGKKDKEGFGGSKGGKFK